MSARTFTRYWPLVAAATLVAAAVFLLARVLSSHRPELETLRTQLTERDHGYTNADSPGSVLIVAGVPTSVERASNPFLAGLLSVSSHSGVEVSDIDVQPPERSAMGAPVHKAKVNGKLTGPFPQVKAVLAEVVKDVSFVSLDSVVLARLPQGPNVEATVQWSVYYKPGAP